MWNLTKQMWKYHKAHYYNYPIYIKKYMNELETGKTGWKVS